MGVGTVLSIAEGDLFIQMIPWKLGRSL